jgi:hypothetical protein
MKKLDGMEHFKYLVIVFNFPLFIVSISGSLAGSFPTCERANSISILLRQLQTGDTSSASQSCDPEADVTA